MVDLKKTSMLVIMILFSLDLLGGNSAQVLANTASSSVKSQSKEQISKQQTTKQTTKSQEQEESTNTENANETETQEQESEVSVEPKVITKTESNKRANDRSSERSAERSTDKSTTDNRSNNEEEDSNSSRSRSRSKKGNGEIDKLVTKINSKAGQNVSSKEDDSDVIFKDEDPNKKGISRYFVASIVFFILALGGAAYLIYSNLLKNNSKVKNKKIGVENDENMLYSHSDHEKASHRHRKSRR